MSEHIGTKLYDLGYHDLVSVIPPGAPLVPSSKIDPSQTGKTPGRPTASGAWAGYGWIKHNVSPEELGQWVAAGANLGLRADYYPGVDIDCLDPGLALGIRAVALELLGPAPERIGRAPKSLLVYRTADPFARVAAILHGPEGVKHLVEVLGKGRQYLVHGQHPGGFAYQWPERHLADVAPADLTEITLEGALGFLEALKHNEGIQMLGYRVETVGDGRGRDEKAGNQDDLQAPSLEALRSAVAVIPNSDELFPDRESYIKMGYAIKASVTPSYEDEAFSIFSEWAGRHQQDERVGGNPETWLSDWRRMRPPYSVGWGWLSQLASSQGDFNAAVHEFEADLEERAIDKARSVTAVAADLGTDMWLTDATVSRYGNRLRYVPASRRWYVWDGVKWAPDAVNLAEGLVVKAMRDVLAGMADTKETKKARDRLQSARAMRDSLAFLRTDPRLTAQMENFDTDPWLLNTPAGQIDLKTGAIVDHDPDKLCSKQTSVAPNNGAPRWDQFLRETTQDNEELILYLKRLAGYALTGDTSEQMLGFIWGPGGNGKSVFLNAILGVLGDYAEQAAMDTFTSSWNDRHSTDLAGLMGARLVAASETQSGRKWDEQRLKSITGGDRVRARFMRQDFFTFLPQFTLLFVGNHKPQVADLDPALRRRIQMIPFTVTPEIVDPHLSEKLRAEYPGILQWMIDGCLEWQQQGLCPPDIVLDTTAEYFEEEDAVGAWVGQELVSDPEVFTGTTELFHAWKQWAHARNEDPRTARWLTQALRSHGLEYKRTTKARGFAGVKIIDPHTGGF